MLKVQGSRFKVQGSRFKVRGSKFEVRGSRFKVQGSRFRVQCFRFQISDSRFQISDFRFQIPDFKFQIPNSNPQPSSHHQNLSRFIGINCQQSTVNYQLFFRTTNNEQLPAINHQQFNSTLITRIRMIFTDYTRDYPLHPCHPCSISHIMAKRYLVAAMP